MAAGGGGGLSESAVSQLRERFSSELHKKFLPDEPLRKGINPRAEIPVGKWLVPPMATESEAANKMLAEEGVGSW